MAAMQILVPERNRPAWLRHLLPLACAGVALLAPGTGWAQSERPDDAPATRAATPADRNTQRVEFIELEDQGSHVQELRSGGQTQHIQVQPKASVPAYDVQPADQSRMRDSEAGPGRTGRRTWKILSF